MVTLEMRTVLLNYAISNAICLGIVFSLWRKHRHCSPAFDFWLGSFTLQFFSMLMFSLRGVVPEPIAILLGVPTSLIGVLSYSIADFAIILGRHGRSVRICFWSPL